MTGLSGSVLAAFISPLLFYAGAGAVAVPILIHLLSRRRFRRIRWAATEFLLQAERRTRRRVRIEQLILLALRCLAMLLLALLVARPFIQHSGIASLIGAGERRERIIVLDDSFSMGAIVGNRTTFELATSRVANLLDWFQQESAGDRVTILLSSEPDAPLAADQYLDDLHLQAMKESLEVCGVSERSFLLEPALVSVRNHLKSLGEAVPAVVYLVSDFRRADWSDASGSALVEALRKLSGLEREQGPIDLKLIDVGTDVGANLAVTDIRATAGRPVAGVGARFDVSVANMGTKPAEGVELRLYVDDATQPGRRISRIEPGQTLRVPIEAAFFQESAGVLRAEVLGADALPIDNSRHVGVHVVAAIRILIVNGEPDADSFNDEVSLLQTALRPEGETFSGNDVTVVEESDWEAAQLEDFDVVILANVYRIADAAVERLEGYVRAGGGTIFFLGDQVNADVYNDLLYRQGRGLLPIQLGGEQRMADGLPGTSIVLDDLTHPVVRAFAGVRQLLGEPKFHGYFTAAESAGDPADSQPVADSPETSATRGPARTVLRLADDAKSPLIVERSFGKGRVILVATGVDREWNNWAEHVSYPIMMLELAAYASRGGSQVGSSVLVGSPIELEFAPDRYDSGGKVKGPDYPATAEAEVRAEPSAESGELLLRWTQTDRSGVYRFELRKRDGTPEVRAAAVNLDPRESDLTKYTEAQLREALADVNFEWVDDTQDRIEAGSVAKRELWPAVLLAVIGVLMVEQFLGWYFGRRT